MKHGRKDYDDILTDPTGKIPNDEPVFLLRGCDPAAAQAVRAWASTHEGNGGDVSMADQARSWADQMDDYRDNRMGRPAKNADRPGDSAPLAGDEAVTPAAAATDTTAGSAQDKPDYPE